MVRREQIILLILCVLFVCPIVVSGANVVSYIDGGEYFWNNGDFESSIAMYQRAIDLHGTPEYDRDMLIREQGRVYFLDHQYQKAIDTLQTIRNENKTAGVYSLMGYFAWKGLKNTSLEHEFYTKAVQSEVRDPIDAVYKADAHRVLGDLNGSLATLQNATVQFNSTGYVWDWKSLYERYTGNISGSFDTMDKGWMLRENKGKEIDYRLDKACYMAMVGNESIPELFNTPNITEQDKKDAEQTINLFLAHVAADNGDLKNASPIFDAYNEENRYHYFSTLFKAQYLLKSGNYEYAEKIFKKINESYSADDLHDMNSFEFAKFFKDSSEMGLFQIALANHNPKKARYYADQLLSRSPDDPRYLKAKQDALNLSIKGT